MNTTQNKPTGRLADLSPFDIRVSIESPTPSHAMRRELIKRGTEANAGYGCVEWYQYPGHRADEATTAD